MLQQMHLKNFTAFNDAVIEFASGVNIIIGENSVGKSHLLKAAYAVMAANYEINDNLAAINQDEEIASKIFVQKFSGVFRVRHFSGLFRHHAGDDDAQVSLTFSQTNLNCGVYLKKLAGGAVALTPVKPSASLPAMPVYFPTRELLSIYPGFVSLYNTRHVRFEETWRDTCNLLGVPLLKDLRQSAIATLLDPIEHAIGGKVLLEENGEFYLDMPDSGKLEMHMVAEGYRKLAMLAHLIANGMIAKGGYLFWDEPESNLNAKLIRVVAQVIVELGRHGVQVFIATHSLFLLRELEILLADIRHPTVAAHYIGLAQGTDGVVATQGERSADLAEIVVLDEHIDQAERYLALED